MKVSNTKAPNSSGSASKPGLPWLHPDGVLRGDAEERLGLGTVQSKEDVPVSVKSHLQSQHFILWHISVRSTRLKIRVAQPKVKDNLKSSDMSKEVGWCRMSVVSEQDGYRQVHMTMGRFFHEFWGSVLGLVLYIFLISMRSFYSTLYQLRKPGSRIFSLLWYNLLGKSHPTT